jgi:5-methylcytosine-specific restriction enzyme A
MPNKAARPCAHRGCSGLTRQGKYCADHQADAKAHDISRGSSAHRGYDHRWRQLRARVMREEPLCRECLREGVTKAGEQVDHIVAKRAGGTDERSNLQNLCAMHHRRKTVKEDGGFGRARSVNR